MKKIISVVFTAVFAVLLILFSNAEELPVISEMPTNITASVGEDILLSCSAEQPSDSAIVKYVWYRMLSPEDEGEAVTETQSLGTYSPNTDFPGEFYYYCVVYHIYEETSTYVKSDVITVRVEGFFNINKPVLITDIETSYSVPKNGELVISVECEPQNEPISISYQWYSKLPSEKVFNKVPGADENTLRVDSDSVGTTQYFCMITSSYGEYSANTQSTIARVEVYSHDHSFGEWSVTVSPSCITAGEEQRTCECGAVEKNVIDAFGHSFGEWVVIRKPTSYTEGERTHTCDICGVVESKSISALGPDTTAENTTEIIESDSESEETSDTVTVTSKEDEKYQPKNVFPWWNAILIFGIVSTVSSAAAAAYFFTKSRKCK